MRCSTLPSAAAARLHLYVRGLRELARNNVELASSKNLAEATGLEAHQIRKDLSYLGSFGKRGVGYQIDVLLEQLTAYLSLSRVWRVGLIGYGRLGSALAAYLATGDRNYRLAAIFDCSAHKIGVTAGTLQVLSWRSIPTVCREQGVDLAIIATPPLAAQGVADLLVEAGVHMILNYAPTILTVPDEISVRNLDLLLELQALTAQQPFKRHPQPRDFAASITMWGQRHL
jgi:redox-sensing transcriptional repressor